MAGSAGPLPTPAYLQAMRKGLEEHGWREGATLQLEQRWGGGRDSAARLAREPMAWGPDVIAAQGAMVLGVRELGLAVPTVFGFSGDPVEAGLVASFAKPGGAFTGIVMQSLELVGKRLEILQQFSPDLQKVGIIANPAHPGEQLEIKASMAAAAALGLSIVYMPGVKQVAIWTGASEKTVKNWFAGRYAPNGAHLVALVRHSDDVLGVFLALSGRDHLMAAMKLEASAEAIAELLAVVRRLRDGGGDEA